jgi:hypothetical protein
MTKPGTRTNPMLSAPRAESFTSLEVSWNCAWSATLRTTFERNRERLCSKHGAERALRYWFWRVNPGPEQSVRQRCGGPNERARKSSAHLVGVGLSNATQSAMLTGDRAPELADFVSGVHLGRGLASSRETVKMQSEGHHRGNPSHAPAPTGCG